MSAVPDIEISRSVEAKDGYSNEAEKLSKRHTVGKIWQIVFASSTLVGIVALTALMLNIINSAFGYVAIENKIQPEHLAMSGVPIEEMSKEDLVTVLGDNVSKGLMRRFEAEMPWEERTREDVYNLVLERVVEPQPVAQWSLYQSLFKVDQIRREIAENYREADVIFRSWITPRFITSPQSSNAFSAGVRTAILGSLWTIFIAIIFSLPIGVGAAIYLQEYAKNNFINRIIQTNINNLAGVPSIIYGILGLALFVRVLSQFTSGVAFGYTDPTTANGRTILSAGLTLGLLILPLIIINAQEAIKAVPNSLREASYGMGATRWQTVWNHVLPSALPGILTGTILAVSRAIGETAPLVVVGASTYITFDPDGPFSKFTTLPIQIYQWTARPQDVFRNIAAGAIIVLMVMLLSMNAIAVLLRNRYSRRV
jgi:phosphate transport system permease protein